MFHSRRRQACGVQALAYTDQQNAHNCAAGVVCKETHSFVYPEGRCSEGYAIACDLVANVTASFTSTYNASGCIEREGAKDRAVFEVSAYAPDEWRTAACTEGRFIEATPSTSTPQMPARLFSLMPASLRPVARFALVLREPVERMLSYFNHQIDAGTLAPGSAFAEYAQARLLARSEAGRYADFLDAFLAAGWARSQLLVLGFRELTESTAAVMKRLTLHYGTPVLVDSPALFAAIDATNPSLPCGRSPRPFLPARAPLPLLITACCLDVPCLPRPTDNAHGHPSKIVSIQCETREQAAAAYAPRNARLYEMLEQHRLQGLVPLLETAMAPFEVIVPCGESELTQAVWESMQQNSTGSV